MPTNPLNQQEQATESLKSLIQEGSDLLHSTHYGVLLGDQEKTKGGNHARFLVWKKNAADFLKAKGLEKESESFLDADEVPMLVRIVEFEDGHPEEIKLNKLIRKEVTKKLKTLRTIRDEWMLEDEIPQTKLFFDTNKSLLYINGKAISIRKFSNQYHLLRVIFEDPQELEKEWFFSEISEKVDEHNPGDRRFSNAAYQVRKKVEAKGYGEFFHTTNQSVRINKKYIP